MPTRGQPIAEGMYAITRKETAIGRETWQLAKMAHSGLLFTSTAEWTEAPPLRWNVKYEVTTHWISEALSVHLNTDGEERASEQHYEGTRYISTTRPAGPGEETTRILELSSRRPIEFPSPIFTAVTLVGLNLLVGQSQPVDTVRVKMPTLEPSLVKLVYTCLKEEKIEVPAGSFSAWHYVRTEIHEAGAGQETQTSDTESKPVSQETHFWADRHGIVLLEQRPDGDTVQLTRYRRMEHR